MSTETNQDLSKLSNDDAKDLLNSLCEKLDNFEAREDEVSKKHGGTAIERDSLLRQIRYEKRSIGSQIKELQFAQMRKGHTPTTSEGGLMSKLSSKKAKSPPEVKLDTLPVETSDKDKLSRLEAILSKERANIEKRKDSIETLLQSSDEYLTEDEKTAKSVKISTQLKTIAQTVNSYKRHTDDVLKICKGSDVATYLDTLEEVIEASSEIDGLVEALEAKNKRNEKVNSAALGNIVLEKYTPCGPEKYLNFYTFFETFTETVLKKEMKDLAKLEYLKRSLGGEALDAVKIYSHGDQLPEALKVLQDLYAKQDLIVAEIYSNLRNMPTIESFKNINLAKTQVQTIQLAMATFKSLGLERELTTETNFQNTYILGDIENKVPLDTKIKWCEMKADMRAKSKEPNMKDFAEFYTKLVNSISEAQHMKQAMDSINENAKKGKQRNDESKGEKRNLLATNVRNYKGKESKNVKITEHNDKHAPKDDRSLGNLPQKGRFLKCYCYFCNSVGHSPNFCKGFKLSFEEKKDLALKHSACLICLKVDGHKSKECTFPIKTCGICNLLHNMNLHSQSEKIKHFKEKKNVRDNKTD